MLFREGEMQKEFEAWRGIEYTIHTEWDWTNPETSRDFSVVAFGLGGEDLQLEHKGGLKTADLAY